jgi:hypothetical protein
MEWNSVTVGSMARERAYGGDEGRAFTVAHSAAKKAEEKPGPG